jgi:hypothetical protein
VNGKEQTALILDDFGLVGRRDEFLDGQWMNIEIFLQIGDVITLWVFKINPGYFFVFEVFHFLLTSKPALGW